MKDEDLAKSARLKLQEIFEYYDDNCESLHAHIKKATQEGKSAALLIMCQNVIIMESLKEIHKEYLQMILDSGAANYNTFIDTPNNELLLTALNRYISKQKK